MAKTEFKQELSSTAANAVYLLKTEDDIITGVLSLQNGGDINKWLADLQGHIYTMGQIIGIVGEGDPNALIYANTNYIANGDSRKVAIEKLDAQLAVHQATLTNHENRLVLLETYQGKTYGTQASAVIANNQAAPADVTGMLIPDALYTSARWEVEVYRHTDSPLHAFANGTVYLQKVNGVWRAKASGFDGEDDAAAGFGLEFSAVLVGLNAQVQYTSSLMAGGAYVGILKHKRLVFDV